MVMADDQTSRDMNDEIDAIDKIPGFRVRNPMYANSSNDSTNVGGEGNKHKDRDNANAEDEPHIAIKTEHNKI